jgi:spermidine synthase
MWALSLLHPPPYKDAMLPWINVDRALSPGGTELLLARRGDEWVVRAAGQVLMSSRVHGSEETLAKYALERVKAPRRVMIGGLGLGYTLRAALDLLPDDAEVRVVELVPELVRWNQTFLKDFAKSPLDDPRVEVVVGDVYDVIMAANATVDLLLLDVDNGPSALTQGGNGRLYSEAGARKCAGALRKEGVLGLWSASADPRYLKNLEAAGLTAQMKDVAARPGSGARDILYLAKKGGPVPQRPPPPEPDRKSKKRR